MEEKFGKDWSEAESPSPTCRQKSLLISSPFFHSLAAASGRLSIMGAREGAGKEGCKLSNGQKVAAHDCFGPDLINLVCESQKEKKEETDSFSGQDSPQ